jgi:hypothetical protein
MRKQSFRRVYTRARQAVVSHAVGQLQAVVVEAVGVLRDGLKAERPADRLRAALGIVAQSLRGAELFHRLDKGTDKDF